MDGNVYNTWYRVVYKAIYNNASSGINLRGKKKHLTPPQWAEKSGNDE
jgi:hypothetical protein